MEYKAEIFALGHPNKIQNPPTAYENFLNERGRDGWTLVSSVRIFRKPAGQMAGSGGPFLPSSDIIELFLTFTRPIKEDVKELTNALAEAELLPVAPVAPEVLPVAPSVSCFSPMVIFGTASSHPASAPASSSPAFEAGSSSPAGIQTISPNNENV
mgnify:CR=1 FL=1